MTTSPSHSQRTLNGDTELACYRLFQLISPSLPIGGFTYSQGLEYAVEAGWVKDRDSLEAWLCNIVMSSIATLELPILAKFYRSLDPGETNQFDTDCITHWSEVLHTSRETRELREEERQRGMAMNTLLKKLEIDLTALNLVEAEPNQLLGLCIAARHWNIDLHSLQQGYLWSWLENIVTAGVKLVPLGQTDGQIALLNITQSFPDAIEKAENIEDWMISSFTPSVALASSLHETQYTRLFRS